MASQVLVSAMQPASSAQYAPTVPSFVAFAGSTHVVAHDIRKELYPYWQSNSVWPSSAQTSPLRPLQRGSGWPVVLHTAVRLPASTRSRHLSAPQAPGDDSVNLFFRRCLRVRRMKGSGRRRICFRRRSTRRLRIHSRRQPPRKHGTRTRAVRLLVVLRAQAARCWSSDSQAYFQYFSGEARVVKRSEAWGGEFQTRIRVRALAGPSYFAS